MLDHHRPTELALLGAAGLAIAPSPPSALATWATAARTVIALHAE